jgi:putative nucleotidyltransferase with HDIG domain
VGERISGWVAQHKKGVLVLDVEKDPRFAKRSHEKYYTKSLISAPIMIDRNVLGVININNKRNRQPYQEEDLDLLETLAIQAALIISNVNLYKELQRLYMNTVEALAEAIDARDHYTKRHSEQVTKYAVAIAKELGLTQKKIEIVERASKLHDIGKIGVHDYILTKPAKLTKEEWEEVKAHSLKGVRILEPLAFLDGVIDTVRQHHERYDGTGYPDKKKAKQIRIEARIMAVADAFDAMTTERPYAKALTREEAIEELKRESGKQFDPQVVEALLRVLAKEKE